MLLDGLGLELLADAGDDAPFLSGLLDGTGLLAGCPTTTATSMGSFGTGLTPGVHGLLGYEVLDPDRGVLLNELKWDAGTDPLRWQPHPTVFGTLACGRRRGHPDRQSGVPRLRADRGGAAGRQLHRRQASACQGRCRGGGAGRPPPGTGLPVLGGRGRRRATRTAGAPRSGGAPLRHADRELGRLARRLPKDTLLVVTADHGMVDVPHRDRVDLAEEPALARGVRVLGGESRFAQLYCEPGAAAGVLRRMAEAFGDRAWVLDRAQAIAAGWFGPVARRNLGRIGDVLVAAAGSFALVDSRTAAPQVLRLIGQHGSLTTAEQRIPLLSMPA